MWEWWTWLWDVTIEASWNSQWSSETGDWVVTEPKSKRWCPVKVLLNEWTAQIYLESIFEEWKATVTTVTTLLLCEVTTGNLGLADEKVGVPEWFWECYVDFRYQNKTQAGVRIPFKKQQYQAHLQNLFYFYRSFMLHKNSQPYLKCTGSLPGNLKICYNTFKLPSFIVRHWSLISGRQGNTERSGHTCTAVLKLHLNQQINILSSSFRDTVVHLGHFPTACRGNLSPSTQSVPQFPWKQLLSFLKKSRQGG